MPATWHIIQTKLATEAKASDSRARRTMCRIPVVCGLWRTAVPLSFYSPFVLTVKPAAERLRTAAVSPANGDTMPELLFLLRQNYGRLARELLSPVFELLRIGRECAEGDLDKLLIVIAVAMRTAEHNKIGEYDLAEVLSGAVDTYPSLSTNVRSVADSTGIPKETVRRKTQALVEAGWIIRQENSLSLSPKASRAITPFRDQILQMAIRNHQTIQGELARDDG
jgi:hypothetical protein